MTLREDMTKFLEDRGMWEDDIAAVLNEVTARPELASLKGRWDEPKDGYPIPVIVGLRMRVRRTAIDYTKTHQPEAWYLPLLEETT